MASIAHDSERDRLGRSAHGTNAPSPDMPQTSRLTTWTPVVAVLLAGCMLRIAYPSRMSVEHFDEGIYASTLWYEDTSNGQAYPARLLYAPPLLPTLIRWIGSSQSLAGIAPFLPSLVTGCITALIVWLMARRWFGHVAGIFAVTIVALSDFHILYSRFALTDVPVLCTTLASIGMGVEGVWRRSWRWMMGAGVLCGVGWWCKFTGWLPAAILSSGLPIWWLIKGRRLVSFRKLLQLYAVFAGSVALLAIPLFLSIDRAGGYQAVVENHAGYVGGWNTWLDRAARQYSQHRFLDGTFSWVAVALGTMLAGVTRWSAVRRAVVTEQKAAALEGREPRFPAAYPAEGLLVRFFIAGLPLALVAHALSTIAVLACVAGCGILGMAMWPVLTDLAERRRQRRTEATEEGGVPFTTADIDAGPALDPILPLCICFVWLVALSIVTPFYHPYPRLTLPLLAAIWMSSAGAMGWWMEANFNVARRRLLRVASDASVASHQIGLLGWTVRLGFLVILLLAWQASSWVPFSPIWEHRNSLETSAERIAEAVQADAREHRPDDASGESTPPPDVVVYAFGEPSLLFHLAKHDVIPAPVGHLNLQAAESKGETLPTYLVFGPHALRTPGFTEMLLDHLYTMRHVGDFDFEPSDVVLLNLFSPNWIFEHRDSEHQRFEVYRVGG